MKERQISLENYSKEYSLNKEGYEHQSLIRAGRNF